MQTQNSSGGSDKYGVFDELRSVGAGLLSQSQPPTDAVSNSSNTALLREERPPTGDKYNVIGDFHSVSSTDINAGAAVIKSGDFGNFSHAPPLSSISTNTATSQQSKDGFPAFSSSSSTSVPPIASSGSDNGSNSGGGFADFASFLDSTSQEVTVSQTGSSNEGWAAFADFTPSQGTSAKPDILSNLPMTSSEDTTTKSKGDSAFDSLLPPELLTSKTTKTVKPVEPAKPVQPARLDSLDIQPIVSTSATSSTTAVGGLGIASFGSDQTSTESKEKKEVKKQLTGLEILEEEFSARVSAKVASSATPADILEPLVPKSAPLDEFGEFEAYSSPEKEKKKANLLTGGESPSSLRKVRGVWVMGQVEVPSRRM